MSSTINKSTIAGLSQSDHHRLLASERRRIVLNVLEGRTTALEFEELASEVAAREEGVDRSDSNARNQVAISLYHHHLPMMAELDVVAYDRETGRVELCL